VGLAIDYVMVQRKEAQLTSAVSDCGGRIGSIPFWPIGTEYRNTMIRLPDENCLNRLHIANLVRGWVGIAFPDSQFSLADRAMLLEKLRNCQLYMVRNGTMIPLDRQSVSGEPARALEPAFGGGAKPESSPPAR
jgi:hypothetical protein